MAHKISDLLSVKHCGSFILFLLIIKSTFIFSQSNETALTPFLQDGLWGYKDKNTGNIVIPAQYTFADYLFTNGFTKVVKMRKAGIINKNGAEIIPCIYDDIEWDPEFKSYISNEGLAKATLNKKMGLINSKNNIIAPFKYDEIGPFKNNIAQIKVDNKYGYISTLGKEVIPCIYDNISTHNNQLYATQNNETKIFNNKGQLLTSHEYNSISLNYQHGLALVRRDSSYGFIDTTGKEIIPSIYNKIIFDSKQNDYFPGGKASVQKNNKFGIIDLKGKVIVPCEYDWEVHLPLYTGFSEVTKNGLSGIIDKTGKEIIPCKYDEINWDVENKKNNNVPTKLLAKTLFIARENDKWGMLDEKNNIIIPFKYEELESFSNGLAVAGLNGKYGYINYNDSIVVPFIYAYCQSFDEVCAIAGNYAFDENKNMYNQFGLINKSGKVIIPLDYSINYLKSQGYYILSTKNQEVGVTDKNGKIIITPKYNMIPFFDTYKSDGIIKVLSRDNRRYGLYLNDQLIAPFIYDEISSFNDDMAAVNKNLKWGFINKKGEETVPAKYDEVNDFSEGMALVKIGIKYGYVNKTGTEVIPVQYFQASNFTDGFARIQTQDATYGIIDKTGTMVIPAIQEDIVLNNNTGSYFTEDITLVKQNSLFGFYNKYGVMIVPCKYTWADFFSQGKAVVVDVSGNYRFVDKSGKSVFPPKFTKAYGFHNGVAIVKLDKKFQMIDTLGKVVKTFSYDEMIPFFDGTAAVKKGNLWGFIDEKGNEIIAPRFEITYTYKDGEATIELNKKIYKYRINTNGEISGAGNK